MNRAAGLIQFLVLDNSANAERQRLALETTKGQSGCAYNRDSVYRWLRAFAGRLTISTCALIGVRDGARRRCPRQLAARHQARQVNDY